MKETELAKINAMLEITGHGKVTMFDVAPALGRTPKDVYIHIDVDGSKTYTIDNRDGDGYRAIAVRESDAGYKGATPSEAMELLLKVNGRLL